MDFLTIVACNREKENDNGFCVEKWLVVCYNLSLLVRFRTMVTSEANLGSNVQNVNVIERPFLNGPFKIKIGVEELNAAERELGIGTEKREVFVNVLMGLVEKTFKGYLDEQHTTLEEYLGHQTRRNDKITHTLYAVGGTLIAAGVVAFAIAPNSISYIREKIGSILPGGGKDGSPSGDSTGSQPIVIGQETPSVKVTVDEQGNPTIDAGNVIVTPAKKPTSTRTPEPLPTKQPISTETSEPEKKKPELVRIGEALVASAYFVNGLEDYNKRNELIGVPFDELGDELENNKKLDGSNESSAKVVDNKDGTVSIIIESTDPLGLVSFDIEAWAKLMKKSGLNYRPYWIYTKHNPDEALVEWAVYTGNRGNMTFIDPESTDFLYDLKFLIGCGREGDPNRNKLNVFFDLSTSDRVPGSVRPDLIDRSKEVKETVELVLGSQRDVIMNWTCNVGE